MFLDTTEVDKATAEFEKELDKLAQFAPLAAARQTQALIAQTQLFKGNTLKSSFTVASTGFKAVVQTKKTYASFLEEGTPAHIIRAKGRFLRMMINGEAVYRKIVHHPGTKPTFFFSLATARAGEDMQAHLDNLGAKLAENF
jgi:hypothetical protein